MKSINKILSIEEQIENLKNSGLKFVNKDSEKKFIVYLTEYNYEILINGYWFEEFYENDGKTFSKDISSNDIRYIFDIDRTISSIIWKYFKGVELHFNAIITNTLCKAFEKYLDGPYASLLDEESSKKIFGNYIPKNDLRKIENKNSSYIKKALLRNASREIWFDALEIKNREFENRKIVEKIDSVSTSKRTKRVAKYALVHLKALSSCWTFSQVKEIYKWLSDDLRNNVIKDFFGHLNINKDIDLENESIALIEVLEKFSDFRNALAHNHKIIDWKLEINTEELAETFSLIINEKIFKKQPYNISYIVKIVQGIKKMENNEISKEIEEYIYKKNEKLNYKVSQNTKKIIKNNLSIEVK
ncbi:MAG: Abi family protein [Mycoplasmoidaceae bacterium]